MGTWKLYFLGVISQGLLCLATAGKEMKEGMSKCGRYKMFTNLGWERDLCLLKNWGSKVREAGKGKQVELIGKKYSQKGTYMVSCHVTGLFDHLLFFASLCFNLFQRLKDSLTNTVQHH